MPVTKDPAKRRPLSIQGHRFVVEYVKDWSAKAAAMRVGVPEKSAQNRASLWLSHPEVKAYIDQCRAAIAERVEDRVQLASERTLQAMSDVAYFDPRKFVNADGSTKKLNELDAQSAMAVAGFETTEVWVGKGKDRRKEVQTKYRLVNRVAALDMAAKVTGEYKADNEQRRSAREMTDEEILGRIATLAGLAPPAGTKVQ